MKFTCMYISLLLLLMPFELFGASSFDLSGERTRRSYLDDVGPSDLLDVPSMLDEVGPSDLLDVPSMLDERGGRNWSRNKGSKPKNSTFKNDEEFNKLFKNMISSSSRGNRSSNKGRRDTATRNEKPQVRVNYPSTLNYQQTFKSDQDETILEDENSHPSISTHEDFTKPHLERSANINIDEDTDRYDNPRNSIRASQILIGGTLIVGVCIIGKILIDWHSSSRTKSVDFDEDQET